MIKFFKHFFYPEVITYSYPKPKEAVIGIITDVLSSKVTLLSSMDMKGTFINSNTFAIESISPVYTRGAKYTSVLNCKIFSSGNDMTEIKTVIRQSITFYIIFCATIIFGLSYLYQFLISGSTSFLFWSFVLLLPGPAAAIGLANVANASIRERYDLYIDKALKA